MTALHDPVERTALLTAALRAVETRREDRLYEDPYAATLCGDTGMALLGEVRAAAVTPGEDGTLPSTPDYNAIRTRFLDDLLQRAAAAPGTTQIVLAPAGLDSRAHRLDWPGHVRWFELDRPAVLGHKRRLLGAETPRVDRREVAVDLTSPDWERDLREAGYDPAVPSVWLVEGLLYYLPGNEVDRVLGRIAAISAPGSTIAADLVNEAALTQPHMKGLLDVFAGWGCPWISGTDDPEALFARHGYEVRAVQPGEEGADFGRWPDPVVPRSEPGVSRVFFVHGRKR
ncbi:class I SAM-dependent methyltransferase [Streptomyces netropsis]|uniref:class I SAM-dependent methyltransferase n=1 Tax=Streptomyces netropsis TaxID=55404 RepID=UPI0037B73D82